MKRYPEDVKDIPEDFFWKYKIIVPDEETRKEIMNAFKTIHGMMELDTDIVIINQLTHEYIEGRNIVLSKGLI